MQLKFMKIESTAESKFENAACVHSLSFLIKTSFHVCT
jgi:hypothetical protein